MNASKELAKELNKTLGEPWANFLLRELVENSRQMGFRGVALLRPEKNKKILWDNLNTDEKRKALGLYYAAAKKLGFKKRGKSDFLWLLFGEEGKKMKK